MITATMPIWVAVVIVVVCGAVATVLLWKDWRRKP